MVRSEERRKAAIEKEFFLSDEGRRGNVME